MKKYTNIIDPKTGRSQIDPQTGKTISVLVDMTPEEIAAFEAERVEQAIKAAEDAAKAAEPTAEQLAMAELKARLDTLEGRVNAIAPGEGAPGAGIVTGIGI